MNEFMDFRVILSRPGAYKHLHGYAGCSLPHCPVSFKGNWSGVMKVLRFVFCEEPGR